MVIPDRSLILTLASVSVDTCRNKSLTLIEKPIGCNKKRMHVQLPFIEPTIQSMKQRFNHLSSQLHPDLDIRFFTKPPAAIQTFFQNKDPIAKHVQSNIVYLCPIQSLCPVLHLENDSSCDDTSL